MSLAAAPPAVERLILTEEPARLQPSRVRGVRLLEDGMIEPTTPWFDYGAAPSRGVAEYVFDAYESGTGHPGGPPGGGDSRCGLAGPGYRYYVGSGHVNNCYVNDLRVALGAEGIAATTLDYGYADFTCELPAVHCIFTAEDFGDSCDGPAYANAYDGVMLEFPGPPPCGGATVTITTPDPLAFQMPFDGHGAYIVIFMERTPEGTLVFDTGAQPFLWSTGDRGPWGRVGVSDHPIQWESDGGPNPVPEGFGVMPDICRDYADSPPCLEHPLGGVLGFGAVGFRPCYADCDRDSTLTTNDYLCFREAYLAADARADCNSDGEITVADFSRFHGAYVLGCPGL